ncbi:hypothetical protein ACO22_05929 [Paracoccidioides brasiliensis]|uniref:Uncharacterized protein n=1 Tax=Paracoccidioides brasiliensis TaxID=121759 RepID=A0A1D2J932_PARBR|nr:hypothetical protein ACO22_05929 [Paracoccidioides brasiliensis]
MVTTGKVLENEEACQFHLDHSNHARAQPPSISTFQDQPPCHLVIPRHQAPRTARL